MKTVDKALSVLDQFSMSRTEIGLSELSRLADIDKAATRRLLVAMTKHGFIEQSEETKKYRLGHGFLRLARIRELTVPLERAAQEVVDWLTQQTNETTHISIPGSHGMTTIGHKLPNRGRVINIVPAQALLYHATASGLAYMTFATEQTRNRLLDLPREKMTDETVISKTELVAAFKTFRAQGYAQTHNTFEADVSSIAMPFFRDHADPAGTIAIALPKAEMTPTRRDALLPLLKDAVARLEQAITGL